MTRNKFLLVLLWVVPLILCSPILSVGQKLTMNDRSRAKDMLKTIRGEIKDKYFDKDLKGIDIDQKFEAAMQKIDNAASLGQAFGIIAQAVLELNDSHTLFYPPQRTVRVEYGFRMKMIGDKCFVIAVKPKSDAEKQGLKIGDQIVKIEGFAPSLKEMWKVMYYYNTISPRAGLVLNVKSPNEDAVKEFSISSKMEKTRTFLDYDEYIRQIGFESNSVIESRFVTVGGVLAWNLPTFAVDPSHVESVMVNRGLNTHNLIIDLRGNGGGYVVTLEALAGFFVKNETKIADLRGRKPLDPQMAKPSKKGTFSGRLIVLVDSQSGSASEIFARFVQINELGIVIGDRSSGSVMQSRGVPLSHGTESVISYGLNLTMADVIMTDGKSLEHVGVTPNLLMAPTADGLSKGEDPVLAAAFELLGSKVSAQQAGKFFPFNWKSEE